MSHINGAVAGFSLLELVIGCALLLLLSALFCGLIGALSDAWLRAGDRAGTLREARAALALITRDIAQATPVDGAVTVEVDGGRRGSIRMLTAARQRGGCALCAVWVRVCRAPDRCGFRIMREFRGAAECVGALGTPTPVARVFGGRDARGGDAGGEGEIVLERVCEFRVESCEGALAVRIGVLDRAAAARAAVALGEGEWVEGRSARYLDLVGRHMGEVRARVALPGGLVVGRLGDGG